MAGKGKKTVADEFRVAAGDAQTVRLALSTQAKFSKFSVWIVGDTPLITHAWSEKARREMLGKQAKAVKGGGKEARDPHADFVNSLYEMGDGTYGFPSMGAKNAFLSVAHKDRGIPRSTVMSALWIDAEMVRTRPAMAGAVCDMPLIRIHGSAPAMREDMVKIGSGLNKKANLAYRAQFTTWAMRVTGKFNAEIITAEALSFLVQEAGLSWSLGEWRNERKGVFGSFHLATAEEEEAWDAYAAGEGPIPGVQYAMAAE